MIQFGNRIDHMINAVPFDGFDEIGGGGLSHALQKVVQTQEHVNVLHHPRPSDRFKILSFQVE
jgi:phosphoribosylaminoimidazole (AIR) synthetase